MPSMNNMDRTSMYGMSGLSGLQLSSSGLDTEGSMPRILEDRMLRNFDSPHMIVNDNSPGDVADKSYTPLNNIMAHKNIAPGNLGMPFSGDSPGSPPPGFGTQPTLPAGSAYMPAESTKKRNWSQRIIEDLQGFLHILTPDGRIVYVSPSGKRLTGYTQDELLGKFIIDFIHPDDSGVFMRDFNESIACGTPLALFYRFRKRDDTYQIFESRGHPHLTSDATMGSSNSANLCRGFFMMACPYPMRNSALLDSFLEHKIENERLTKRINDLKREEAEEAEEDQRQWQKKHGWRPDVLPEEVNVMRRASMSTALSPSAMSTNHMAMPYPASPFSDNMARYDGVTHIETIEMLTGLRYQDGERSQGISTGGQSPELVKGDVGIAIPVNKEPKSGDKKKKIKLPDEYVCTDCGTLESPEWRKGPSGPKTLCNACGLRWAKKEKRKSGSVPVPLMVFSGLK